MTMCIFNCVHFHLHIKAVSFYLSFNSASPKQPIAMCKFPNIMSCVLQDCTERGSESGAFCYAFLSYSPLNESGTIHFK